MTLAISAPIAISEETCCNGELIADAPIIISPQPGVVSPNICRYAGPEYFGFGGTTVKTVNPATIKTDIIPTADADVASYIPMQTNISNIKATDINSINKVGVDTNFVNTDYGSVKVIDPSGHFIFK